MLREKYQDLEQQLIDSGVHVMRNQAEKLMENGDTIQLIAVDAPRGCCKRSRKYQCGRWL